MQIAFPVARRYYAKPSKPASVYWMLASGPNVRMPSFTDFQKAPSCKSCQSCPKLTLVAATQTAL